MRRRMSRFALSRNGFESVCERMSNNIYFVPADTSIRHVAVPSREYMNLLRVHVVVACRAALAEIYGENAEVTRSVEQWADPRNERLYFEYMPRAYDVQTLPFLSQAHLFGAYTFVYHDVDRGAFSVGQVYDMFTMLDRLKRFLMPLWPQQMYQDLKAMLSACNERACCVTLTREQPRSRRSSVTPQPKTTPFSHYDSGALKRLADLTQAQAYDPASPTMPVTVHDHN